MASEVKLNSFHGLNRHPLAMLNMPPFPSVSVRRPVVNRGFQFMRQSRGLIMDIENITPEQIMYELGYLCAQAYEEGMPIVSDKLKMISDKLAYYFELQRQKEI